MSSIALLVLVGCDNGGGSGGAGGSSGTSNPSGTGTQSGPGSSSGSPPMGVVLTPSSTGYVSGDSAGVVGSWYVYGDSFGSDGMTSDGDCEEKGGFPSTDCSTVTSPTPGAGSFPPNAKGQMCLVGTAAQVINGTNGMPDYSDIFGIGIGLDLNDPGGDAGSAPGYYDASMYTGISFDIDSAQQNLRVQFPTMETVASGDSAYWGGATGSSSPVTPGTNTFTWDDVGGPSYAMNPPAFDNKSIQAIQFAVYTDATSTVPVSFCISNLTLTTN